ncbi:major capsid protein [Corynebacterium sp. P6129]|uniref:phage major capsid protein n=1 Tax=Corynebacterium antarcticum TaxID=2800405 RepID=UPI002260AB83|nr:major capsid protein [Corynebacterium antarcticum]MCX7491476.1 major capsid protein [Corynebacterium antarcticum]
MATVIDSYTSGDTIIVDRVIKDPTLIPSMVKANLEGAFIEELLFRDGGTNDGMVYFEEAASRYLFDDARDVAEFAEIPVSDPSTGNVRSIIGKKTALAIRVSWEMRRFNRVDELTKRLTALQNTMIRNSVRASLGAFSAVETQTMAASAKWTDSGADPITDLLTAIGSVQAAKPEDAADEEMTFEYNPNTLLLSPAGWTALLRNREAREMFQGNAADRNPLLDGVNYRGIVARGYLGLDVAVSSWVPKGEVYVLERGVCGFKSEAQPLTMTELYPEGGGGYGGPTQSWRADAFAHRILACDNPKSVMKMTGVLA